MTENQKQHAEDTEFPRRILLAVTGLSPQVVTETLFALAVEQAPAFVPTQVQLITTAEGAERARLSLLSDDPGWFARLLGDYALPPVTFGPEQIHVLQDGAGRPLDDIRTPDGNERAADLITEKVRELTADPRSALHASIAGGRKTMGFYLGYALSLYGRSQDRLSHVLVPEPFESSWDFFYPTPYSRVITTRDNKLVNTAEAEVALAEIPFVSMRHGMPAVLLDGKSSFSEAVAAARRALGPKELIIDYAARRIRAGGAIVDLPPALLAFLGWVARRRVQQGELVNCPAEGVPEYAFAEEYLDEYRAIIGEMGDDERTARRLRKGMDKAFFSETKSKLHRTLRERLAAAATPYLVASSGRPRRYGLDVPKGAVRFSAGELFGSTS